MELRFQMPALQKDDKEMSVHCKLVSLDGLTKEIELPYSGDQTMIATAVVEPLAHRISYDPPTYVGVRTRNYRYVNTETIRVYREVPNDKA